jgi:RNA polymerase sigma factor for flagellar operon FliA
MTTKEMWDAYRTEKTSSIKKQLILNYIKLVHYVIHNSKFINFDTLDDRDYFQFGVEGLSEAIDRFDPQHGTKFETYAIPRIKRKIIEEIRKVDKTAPDISMEYIPSKPKVVESLLEAIKDLDVRDKRMLTYYYFESLSYGEIAKLLHVSPDHVSQVHRRILEILKSKLSYPEEESIGV